MHIYSRGGFGEPEPKPETTSAGDEVGRWHCENPAKGARVIGLKVTFRRSFADFRREVQRAVERFVFDPRVASKLVTESENLLKGHHKQMVAEGVPHNAPVRLAGSFFYEAAPCY
jgi:hypothetical protein